MNNELTTTIQATGEAQADETIASAESPALQASAVPPPPSPKQRPNEINNAFRRSLKARGHHLKPVVQIGQGGISPGVIEATQVALEQHELIKISINGESPTERKSGAEVLAKATGAHIVQVIGRVILLYRESERVKTGGLSTKEGPDKKKGKPSKKKKSRGSDKRPTRSKK